MEESWKRVEELFHRALEVPPGAPRDAWLEAECRGDAALKQEVVSLLAHDGDAETHAFGGPIARAAGKLATDSSSGTLVRPRVGPYRLLRKIGQGGMGTVYLATRDDGQYAQTVAVKLVRRGMDTAFILRRFRRERQILARLEHPNIGRMLDGGTTEDGVPFLVMEYIEGLSITRWCEEKRASIKERLRLFLEVCAAVNHAHANLVIHRDLKPGNILVDRTGRPKLLDFGICKLLYQDGGDASHTQTLEWNALTPEYASPEQVLGEPVTVASDVYSLGVVLYELLTGTRPHRLEKRTPQAVEEAVCRKAVPLPSERVRASGVPRAAALARALAGDLDNIVFRAMHRVPERRYASPEELASDVRSYLANRPVSARPDTLAYRSVKFLRRNAVAVAAAACVVAAFSAGLAFSSRQARDANRDLRRLRESDASLVSQLADAVEAAAPATRGDLARRTSETLDHLAAGATNDDTLELAVAGASLRIGELTGKPDAASATLARANAERARAVADRLLARRPDHPDARALRDRAAALSRRLGEKP
jgi:serine/threonine protein kinase